MHLSIQLTKSKPGKSVTLGVQAFGQVFVVLFIVSYLRRGSGSVGRDVILQS